MLNPFASEDFLIRTSILKKVVIRLGGENAGISKIIMIVIFFFIFGMFINSFTIQVMEIPIFFMLGIDSTQDLSPGAWQYLTLGSGQIRGFFLGGGGIP